MKTYLTKVFSNTQFLLDMDGGDTRFLDANVCNRKSLAATASRLKKEERGRWMISRQGNRIAIYRIK